MHNLNLEILNRIAGGNTMAWMLDQEEEQRAQQEDNYICYRCASIVKESEFNHKKLICFMCEEA